MWYSAVYILLLLASVVFANIVTTPIKFLLMVSTDSSPDSSAVVPAVDQTLEEINRNTSTLPGHHLEYILRESNCSRTAALDSFFDVATDSSVVAVVGCGCSAATEEVAKISHYFNKSVISYASTSVVLSDRSVYRSFFRTVPSDELLVSAVATIMNHYGWRQLSAFTEEQPQYLKFLVKVQQAPVTTTITSYQFGSDVVRNYFTFANKSSIVFDKEPHIFLLNTGAHMATLTLCTAYHNGRYYPNYAWILLQHHEADWWREHYMKTNCSDTDIMKVLNRSLILLPYHDTDNKNKHKHQYTEQIQESDLYNVSAYASDAVRVLAEALHNCFSKVGHGFNTSICYTGTQLDWNITITGHTGKLSFEASNGNRIAATTLIQQYQSTDYGNTLKPIIGKVLNINQSYIEFGTLLSSWPDGLPPDGTPITTIQVNLTVIFFQVILSGIVLSCGVVCLVFNIVFRNRKVIKLTSPCLNYVLIVGGVMCLAIGLVTVPSTHPLLSYFGCEVTTIFSAIGYDIVLAVPLLKTFRVYYIFKNPFPNKKVIRDWHLLLMLCFMLLVEIGLVIAKLSLAYVRATTQHVMGESIINDQGITVHVFFNTCDYESTHFFIIFILSNVYKLIIQVIALVMAFLIRNIEIDALNDSRETRAMIYIIAILGVLTGALYLAFDQNYTMKQITLALHIFLVCITVLGLMFAPKVIALYKDPKGVNVFKAKQLKSINTTDVSLNNLRNTADTSTNERGPSDLIERVEQSEHTGFLT